MATSEACTYAMQQNSLSSHDSCPFLRHTKGELSDRNDFLEKIIQLIKKAKTIVLSTHRQCDGDGLGAELAMSYALKKLNKDVRVINVDPTPRKYRFLNPDQLISYFENDPQMEFKADLCLIFDTNDWRLLEPLYASLKAHCLQIAFIDHHPVLKKGPLPTESSLIDTDCASTGEMVYRLIKALGVPMDRDIARCLYTSVTFDTQLYRYIRNSPVSHQIAAELLTHDVNPEEVHRHLFGDQTIGKIAFLAQALSEIEYFSKERLAVLKVRSADLLQYQLEPDEARDVIDMLMNIETLEAAALFREDGPSAFKVSLRSKGQLEVVSLAESIGGGGHAHAAGAFVKGDYTQIKDNIVKVLLAKLEKI